ncbi:MAG TPA: SET domain-containing methyltransferase [Acidimicrobiales bacterium]
MRTEQATSSRCHVRTSDSGRGVYASEPIAAGECVLVLPAVFDTTPGRHTIQVGAGRHQAFTNEIDDFLNHSCDPNAVVDAENLRILALRPIAAGEEVTFHYEASEWDMAEPFLCQCPSGTPRLIRGFRHLSAAERALLAPLVPTWLRALDAPPGT